MPQPVKSTRATAPSQRLKMRRELAAAAMNLFATKGYEATTVDEIAATAGVARRTFFRHFRSKEEAIFPDHDDTLERARAVLDAAPAHENPLDTVCRGIKEVMKMYAASPAGSVERYKLTRQVPALREREIASVARYERLFTRYLLGHFPESAHRDGDDDPLLAEVAASAVVTAHNHVLRRWLRAGAQGDVETQLDGAFVIVRRTFGTGFSHHRETPGAAPSATARGEVLVTVTHTDTPLPQIMRTIESALHSHRAGSAEQRSAGARFTGAQDSGAQFTGAQGSEGQSEGEEPAGEKPVAEGTTGDKPADDKPVGEGPATG